MSKILNPIRLSGIAILSAATLPAFAASPEALRQLPEAQQRAYVLQRVAAQNTRAKSLAAAADTTPPVLTQFVLDKASVKAGQAVVARVKVTDDLSGVSSVTVYAHNAAGASISLTNGSGTNYPATKYQGWVSTEATDYLASGDYAFDWGYAADAAGNFSYFDATQLGHAVVTLNNAKGGDTAAPLLVGGKLVTSKLSLAATQPGASLPAYAGLDVEMSDSSDGIVSGLAFAYASFCTADGIICFGLSANLSAPARDHVKLTLGGIPAYSFGVVPGSYKLKQMTLTDHAGNSSYLFSTEFPGGNTDFSLYFPSTTITIKP